MKLVSKKATFYFSLPLFQNCGTCGREHSLTRKWPRLAHWKRMTQRVHLRMAVCLKCFRLTKLSPLGSQTLISLWSWYHTSFPSSRSFLDTMTLATLYFLVTKDLRLPPSAHYRQCIYKGQGANLLESRPILLSYIFSFFLWLKITSSILPIFYHLKTK